MQYPLKEFSILFLVACRVIASYDWLGVDLFSHNKYEIWEFPVMRVVVTV